ncbi:uncharacterized protein LOC108904800 [Anoplophora glabripennis]|uniref:uncharacterized protein LOC108904800 n=1 Tax=Anoplophora glabripennis TaxID=217634 RepID=UPI000874D711|nr:uncharacterized protein LOC108904800 [Anoplophora glabripennis]
MATTVQEIKTYIKKALEDQRFLKCEVALTGSSENSDGFVSDITFATVSVTTKDGIEKTIEVAVKSSKKKLIQAIPRLYGREAYIYGAVIPAFTEFQMQNNIKNVFSSVPKCYRTISDETVEIIVMENLKKNGYELFDRKKPLDLNHLKLVLQEYGKFHAISFALRNKSRCDFEKLVTNFDEVMTHFCMKSFKKTMQQCLVRACDIVKEVGEMKLYEMCYKIVEKDAYVAMIEILETEEPMSAILHGDGWSNNFMYKYEGSKNPSKLAILDWQLSRLHSPVLDLSYLIYTTCSGEELKHFDELLDTYYASFSAFLTELGCNSESLFPYSALLRHWKKYSLFGLLTVIMYLHLFLCETEDVPDLSQCKNESEYIEQMMDIKITDGHQYRKRIIAVINHYCSFSDT